MQKTFDLFNPALFSDVATPLTPDVGYLSIYSKSGVLTALDSSGTENTLLTSSLAGNTYLPLAGGTLVGDLKFTDATYDIGKSGATRPRDGFFSRNLTVGGNLVLPNSGTYSGITAGGTGLIGISGGTSPFLSYNAGMQLIVGPIGPFWGGIAYTHVGYGFYNSPYTSIDAAFIPDGAGIIAQRNGTNAQTFRLYNTYTSDTSFENLQFKAVAAGSYQIGSAIGSAGGTNRAIDFGVWDSASAFTTYMSMYAGGFIRLGRQNYGMIDVGNTGATNYYDGAVHYFRSATTTTSYANFQSSGITFNRPVIVSQFVSISGSPTAFTLTGATHTTLTASTEATDVNFNLARTVQFSTGSLTTQRAMRIQAPTYSFVGASTITTASTLSISGAPVAGTNATITNAYALNVESGTSNFGGHLRVSSGGLSIYSGELYIHQQIFAQDAVINLGGSKIRSGPGWGAMSDLSIAFDNSAGTQMFRVDTGFFAQFSNDSHLRFSSNASTGDTCIYRDAVGILAQRNGTNAQTFRLYNTYTSTTSFENLQFKAVAAGSYQIGSTIGSAGGTNRAIEIGHYNSAGTFTGALSIATNGSLSNSRGLTASEYFGANAGVNASNTGTSNAGFGYQALYGNTTGTNNTSLGCQALANNSTGNNNAGFGMQALNFNTTGAGNTANGFRALFSNTTGGNNAATGYESLRDNTTGNYNAGQGFRSIASNKTGTGNSAIGYATLYDLGTNQTAGVFNIGTSYTIVTVGTTDFTLIGAASNTVGVVFTATGVGSGTGTASPYNANNTAVGYNTGRGIIYGTGNTIIGANVTGLSAGLNNNVIIADGAGNQRINIDNLGNSTFSGKITSNSQLTQVPPASVTLTINGQFSIEMTSDTAGNLVYRGSDGTTRRAAITFT